MRTRCRATTASTPLSRLSANSVTRTAIYPGSFDPLTNGHIDIIQRGLNLFDRVIVAVALNVRKNAPLFTVEERLETIRDIFDGTGVEAMTFEGLLVDFAADQGACAILRGIRGPDDVAYEIQMVQMNRRLQPDVETIFVTSSSETQFISSSLVKEVARFGGDISAFVPKQIAVELSKRLAKT